MKKKTKIALISILLVIALLVSGAFIGMNAVFKEHREILGLPLDAINFTCLKDGVFIGEFDGGMYGWRNNSVKVTISDGEITDIILLEAAFESTGTTDPRPLYNEIITNQTLEVDSISGATITSKGYLLAVEDALAQSQK